MQFGQRPAKETENEAEKGETEGSGPGPPSIVWVLGYDQRLRTESDVFVQPNFFRLIDVVSAHGLDLEGARAILVLPTAHRPSLRQGRHPRTITYDASWCHKRQIIYARPRSDAIVRHPKQVDTAHMPQRLSARLKLGKTPIDVLKKI
jgi:hypothetical protein